MTATLNPPDRLVSQLVNSLLSLPFLAKFAKDRARALIIKRAEAIGVAWRDDVKSLRSRGGAEAFSPQWEADLAQITNPALEYPEYYLTSFHAYDRGNMSWDAAMEVEVAAYSVGSLYFDPPQKYRAISRSLFHARHFPSINRCGISTADDYRQHATPSHRYRSGCVSQNLFTNRSKPHQKILDSLFQTFGFLKRRAQHQNS
jgi:hypothetical protein